MKTFQLFSVHSFRFFVGPTFKVLQSASHAPEMPQLLRLRKVRMAPRSPFVIHQRCVVCASNVNRGAPTVRCLGVGRMIVRAIASLVSLSHALARLKCVVVGDTPMRPQEAMDACAARGSAFT